MPHIKEQGGLTSLLTRVYRALNKRALQEELKQRRETQESISSENTMNLPRLRENYVESCSPAPEIYVDSGKTRAYYK